MRERLNLLRNRISADVEIGLLLPKDAEELFAVVDGSRRHLSKYLTWTDRVDSVQNEEEFLVLALAALSVGTGYHFGIWRSNQLAGTVSIEVDQVNNSGEIGYFLGQNFVGTGLMTLAVLAIVNFGFATLGLMRIEANIAATNIDSRNVCLRAGLLSESVSKKALFIGNKFLDKETFACFADSWEPSELRL